MARKELTAKEKNEEQKVKAICKVFKSAGITVRREKLSRGHAFRVKSGACYFSGDNILFVDKNLPNDQQFSVLCDAFEKLGLIKDAPDLSKLTPAAIELVSLEQEPSRQLSE
jgi:hypothetical protein